MGNQVLLVEDDDDVREKLRRSLTESSSLEVLAVPTAIACIKRFEQPKCKPDAMIVDLHIKAGPGGDRALQEYPKHDRTGYNLARKIHHEHPQLRIFGFTGLMEGITPECESWFRTVGDPMTGIGVYHKQSQWVLLRHRVFKLTGRPSPVKVFIAYGHDHRTMDELREYALGQGWDVEVLRESQSPNRSWIEQFEVQAGGASLAWVLFTPDEWGGPYREDLAPERRPRPNVLLECGYFLGAFGRLSNRVLLFKKGNVSLPSDLLGVHPIDIGGSVEDEKQKILCQLRPWL
jgi:CheY-like chemotaxis protein